MRVLYAFAVISAAKIARPSDGFFLDALSFVSDCGSVDFDGCLARTIDDVIKKNETYRLNRYLTVTLDRVGTAAPGDGNFRPRENVDDGDSTTSILRFFNALRVQYRPEEGADDEPAVRNFQGRKKKNKGDKHNKMGMMLGAASMGMTVVSGVMTKMMMGGVMMIATKALLIAKLALALASILVLKKMFGGGGGAGVVQPSYSGGGTSEHAGYSRSYDAQLPNHEPGAKEAAAAIAYHGQLKRDSYGDENGGWRSQYPQ
ncbi:Protein of unknown function DUF1676 [Cinara cedri]|uniref:Uncharacterized protein n=1 Tax=Cinara cedri TaxID=506608 RepID=A0A5E4MVK4_9HEMI|nr:Protein of unknown function DUF1676 [Cinara cedri]